MKMKKGKGKREEGRGFLGGIVRGFLAVALCAVGLSAMAAIKDPTDVIEWGTASMAYDEAPTYHGKFLEASADAMIARYTAAIAKDATDYGARICRAFAYMKKAGENQTFGELAQKFGFTFEADTMRFTGELIHEKGKTPEMNDTIDTACGILLPLMKAAYEDLGAIPKNWKGSAPVTSEFYPVDEDVYFDLADVHCMRAALAQMMCVLNIMKGYDTTLDSDLLKETFNAHNADGSVRGVQAIFDNNPEFMGKARDPKAFAEAGDWWASAATLMDQWDKAQARRSDGKPHFFEWDMSKIDDDDAIAYGVGWLRQYRNEIINLPYRTSAFDEPLLLLWDKQAWTLKTFFEGKFLRANIPQFTATVKAPYYNEPSLDTLADPTFAGMFPGMSRNDVGAFLNGDSDDQVVKVDLPPYTSDDSCPWYAIYYKSTPVLDCDLGDNPVMFAWDFATPIALLDPTFSVRGVTAAFEGWTDDKGWNDGTLHTPMEEVKERINRKVELTAHFGALQVTYLDFDETTHGLVERTDACEIVTNGMTRFEAGKVYAVANDVTLEARVTVDGTPESPTKLVLCDGATLTAEKGIEVSASGTTTNALIICGQKLGTGILETTGGTGLAGIGGGQGRSCGIVTINGGTVMAKGGSSAAGIGTGGVAYGGIVTINGGIVTATGSNGAAGIGVSPNADYDLTVAFGEGTKFVVKAGDDAASAVEVPQEDYEKDHSAAYAHIEPGAPKPEISAVSAEGFLDLTVGDRVVTEDEEPIVADPKWGEAATATVKIEGEEPRQYNALTIDTWQTAELTPGRYPMTFEAGALVGDDAYTAAFWKIDTTSWEVLDNSNITADKTFEEGKTYLVLGTNTVNGKTLTVEDGAKFEYGKGAAGFLGGTVAELPKRYEQKTVGDLIQIVEKIKGCADNPWEIGDGVEAYTNGTDNLVIVGTGTITDLSDIPAGVKGGIETITIPEATVKGAADGAFTGLNNVALTLPDGWQGELPKNGSWYGATGVKLTRWPMAVKNVKPQQRYPWNGLVDVTYDVSGTGSVKVVVSVTTNGVKAVANPTVTGDVTADLGDGKELKDVLKLTWDAKADFGDEELHEKIKVKLSLEKAELD